MIISFEAAREAVGIIAKYDYSLLRKCGNRGQIPEGSDNILLINAGSEVTVVGVQVDQEAVICKLPKNILNWRKYSDFQIRGQRIMEEQNCPYFAPYTIGPILFPGLPYTRVLCQSLVRGTNASQQEINETLKGYGLEMLDAHVIGNAIKDAKKNMVVVVDMGQVNLIRRT